MNELAKNILFCLRIKTIFGTNNHYKISLLYKL
jgi:hypothetical protein